MTSLAISFLSAPLTHDFTCTHNFVDLLAVILCIDYDFIRVSGAFKKFLPLADKCARIFQR